LTPKIGIAERRAFTAYLAPLRRAEWVVYSKRPFGGAEAGLAYLSRYTHRVAISNSRLIDITNTSATFRWKDYRANGRHRAKVMTLAIDELNIQGGSRMRKCRMSGSVRGVPSNGHPTAIGVRFALQLITKAVGLCGR
jgi:hypothetical protein